MNNKHKKKNKYKKYNASKLINKDNIKGGCSEGSCNEINIEINIGNVLETVLNGIFYPINFLIKLVIEAIKLIIKHWNDNIYTLSFIIERFINLQIFSINGYINVLGLILTEVKTILKFSLLGLKYNTFIIISALFIPIINEIATFLLDSVSINIFIELLNGNTNYFTKFLKSIYHLFTGKTVKPYCNINDYSNEKEMYENCYQHVVPSCSLNLATIWTISYYVLIITYISAWYSFLKLFYDTSFSISIIEYIINYYNN